jgi:hypothetical protein
MNKKGKDIFLGFLGFILFLSPIILIIAYSEYNKRNYESCELLNADVLPKVCKLSYPILKSDEIKKIKTENEELKFRVSELEQRIEDIKDVTENGKEDNWEPDPPQINY